MSLREVTQIVVLSSPVRVEIHSTNLLFSKRLELRGYFDKVLTELSLELRGYFDKGLTETSLDPKSLPSQLLGKLVQWLEEEGFGDIEVYLTYQGDTWEMKYKVPRIGGPEKTSRFERLREEEVL